MQLNTLHFYTLKGRILCTTCMYDSLLHGLSRVICAAYKELKDQISKHVVPLGCFNNVLLHLDYTHL